VIKREMTPPVSQPAGREEGFRLSKIAFDGAEHFSVAELEVFLVEPMGSAP
jgi:hypothetical protein